MSGSAFKYIITNLLELNRTGKLNSKETKRIAHAPSEERTTQCGLVSMRSTHFEEVKSWINGRK